MVTVRVLITSIGLVHKASSSGSGCVSAEYTLFWAPEKRTGAMFTGAALMRPLDPSDLMVVCVAPETRQTLDVLAMDSNIDRNHVLEALIPETRSVEEQYQAVEERVSHVVGNRVELECHNVEGVNAEHGLDGTDSPCPERATERQEGQRS